MKIYNKTLNDLIDYARDFSPTYHLTLQWDKNHRARTIPTLEKRLYYFMSRVQRELLGRTWYRRCIPFIAFGETDHNRVYHIHILIKDSMFTKDRWEKVFDKIVKRAKRTPVPKAPFLQGIIPGTEFRVAKYDAKQLNPNRSGNSFADSVVISSEYLFQKKKRGEHWAGRIL